MLSLPCRGGDGPEDPRHLVVRLPLRGAGLMILVPYTRLDPRTVRLLEAHAPGYTPVLVDGPTSYWSVLAEAWTAPEDLTVIEHDIGIHGQVIPQFQECRQGWCGNPYNIGGTMLVCLGCTRFTDELKTANPDLLEVVGEVGGDGLPVRDWRRLDVRLADELHRRGYQVHTHRPTVDHFHEYS